MEVPAQEPDSAPARVPGRTVRLGRVTVRPDWMIPRMRWWEWAWYVPAVIASGLAYDRMSDWLQAVIRPVPVLGWFAWLISTVVLGTLFAGISYVALPARQARKEAPGEALLACGLWGLGVGLQWLLGTRLFP